MRNKLVILKFLVFGVWLFALMGCGKENDVEGGYEEIISEFVEEYTEVKEENSDEKDEKIQYFDNLDNHMQVLYDAFLVSDWEMINELLEEYEIQDVEKCAIYQTPLENIFLVIDYIPEVRSWQAYMGELLELQKDGMGVMVSKRENGYVDANVYIGTWRNNMPNGDGILSDGITDIKHVFKGTFIGGKFDSDIQVYRLETPEIYVDWNLFESRYSVDATWSYCALSFDNGKPIPAEKNVVEQYISSSGLSEYELEWVELESDGQFYYRIYNDRYNYILSIGAKEPADGYRGNICPIHGTLFDDFQNTEATYGVPCYSTNKLD